MKITTEISLDLARNTMPITLFAKQFDNDTREILITMLDRGQAYTLESGITARLQIKKPDGTQVIKDCTIAGGKISAELSGQALAAAGVATAEIGLYKGEELLTSQTFMIDIKPSAYDFEQVESSDEYSSLVQATAEADKWGNVTAKAQSVSAEESASVTLKDTEDGKEFDFKIPRGKNSITVVQETGESTEDVMSQKAVSGELKKLETSIDDNKVTIAQETGTSEENVMSQKAVTDALDKHKGVNVVQETGESTEDVMSQKAVTDAISDSEKGFVKKEGDEMTGKLTAPTFKGDLEGNATTSTYPKGFESGDLDEVVAFLEANNVPYNEVFCFRAPANTKSPVPLEANDQRRIFGCVMPGNVLNIFAEGYFNQAASLKNKSTGYAVLSRADVQNEYVTDRNYYNIYPVKVVNELFNQCEPNREYYYNFYNYYTSSATVEEKHTIHDRIGAKNGRNSKLKATLYCEINCKPTGEENYKTYAKVYDITYFPCRDYSNPSVCIINGEIIPKKEVQWSGGYSETSYQTVTYTTGEMSLEITRMESNFDLTFTLNVEALQGHEYHQIFYKSW